MLLGARAVKAAAWMSFSLLSLFFVIACSSVNDVVTAGDPAAPAPNEEGEEGSPPTEEDTQANGASGSGTGASGASGSGSTPGASKDAGTNPAADAQSPTPPTPSTPTPAAPGNVVCGNETCIKGSTTCCWIRDANGGPGFGNCRKNIGGVSSCGGNFARVLCAGSADCAPGGTCCATRLKGSSLLIQVACQTGTSCTTSDPQNYYAHKTCNPLSGGSDCPQGWICEPDEGTSAPFGACLKL